MVFEVAAAAHLEYGGVRATGSARLAVFTQLEGGTESLGAEVTGTTSPGRVELPGQGRRLVRLRLRNEGSGELLVASPRLVGEPEPAFDSVAAATPAAAARPAAASNIVLFVVDTLRRDRLGTYGGRRGLTPRLDAFAGTATVFDEAVAQSSWTRPAVATLLTGLVPPAHGVTTLRDSLPREATTVAESLRDAGYATAAVSTNWHVSQQTGMRQGFRDFMLEPEAPAHQVVADGIAWLDRRSVGQPFFLYLHVLDPHAPYAPPADLRTRYAADVRDRAGTLRDLSRVYASHGKRRQARMAELRELYDGEVAAADRAFGELLDALEQRRLGAQTLILFVADHGEEFDEHGQLGHGNHLHSEVLDIPLMLHAPGQHSGARRADLAQQIDVLPTLLAAAGVKTPPGLPGHALGAAAAGERAAFSHSDYGGRQSVSLQRHGFKLIVPRLPPGPPQLFDHRSDPGELADLAARLPLRVLFMLSDLRAREAAAQGGLKPASAVLPEEAQRALRALGYLE